ncbi:Dihydropyrimidine dehydrogenase [Quillaja saponaria]|uniref:Dihydropyrimidine dehydrogenase n=1 Tax=Quillaja saponaria TaxID=32244 RepID=A0AAD7M7D2_QUISA|nr:Dihydropyrimidine dehydrogenase [Quillaja saponaria]
MGAAVGQDCALLEEVCEWINAKAAILVGCKMTPNIIDISEVACKALTRQIYGSLIYNLAQRCHGLYCPHSQGFIPSRVYRRLGCEGVAAISTIISVMGINLKTLRPEPCVEGYSTPGGYSAKVVLRRGDDAAEFILLGANTVQVCTGVMMHRYGLVKKLCAELKDAEFKKFRKNFSSIEDFRGASLQYFTTHGFSPNAAGSNSTEEGYQERLGV